jgi:hypothetical protein
MQFKIQMPIRRSVNVSGIRYFLSFPQLKFQVDCQFQDNLYRAIPYISVWCQFDGNDYAIPLLPNFFNHGTVCLGDNLVGHHQFEEAKKAAIESFWTTQFDHEDISCGRFVNHLGFENIQDYLQYWQQKTKEDPSWIPDKNFFKVEEFLKVEDLSLWRQN